MTQKTAKKRYFKTFVPTMIGYVLSIFGISWAEDSGHLSAPAIYILTLIPIICIFAWMWSQWRYVKELDEYLSKLQTEAMMIGLMIVVAIATGWGLMELMADVPRIPIFFAGPGFYLIYGLVYMVLAKRAGLKGICL